MPRILIIGYGNPLRCDDGFGWHLAQRLQRRLAYSHIEILALHQLMPELAELISRAHYVIFADATCTPMASTTSLCRIKASDTKDTNFSHHVGPQMLLAMAQTLFGSSPRAAFLVTAHAQELGYGERLSPQMTGALDKAVDRVVSLCEFLAPQLQENCSATYASQVARSKDSVRVGFKQAASNPHTLEPHCYISDGASRRAENLVPSFAVQFRSGV